MLTTLNQRLLSSTVGFCVLLGLSAVAHADTQREFPYQSAYPYQYESNNERTDTIVPRSIALMHERLGLNPPKQVYSVSPDILATLPVEFALAYESGHLICVQDVSGTISERRSDTFGRLWTWTHNISSEFRSVTKKMSLSGLDSFAPLGYPNVACFRPSEPAGTLFSERWFSDWLVYLDRWQRSELELQAMRKSVQQIASSIAETSLILRDTEKETWRVMEERANLEPKVRQSETELARLKRLEAAGLLADSAGADIKSAPPFDPIIRYDPKVDPFLEVTERYLKELPPDVRRSNVANPRYDETVLDALVGMNRAFENPDAISDPTLRDQVLKLKREGMEHLVVTSGTRTPWQQACVAFDKNRTLPAATYLGSPHLFGFAVDINTKFKWTSDNHATLRSVAKTFGFKFPRDDDPVHMVLAVETSRMLDNRLLMAYGYRRVAERLVTKQADEKHNLIFTQSSMIEQQSRLNKDLLAKQRRLDDERKKLQTVTTRYEEVTADIARIKEELRRRDAERRRDQPPKERPVNGDDKPERRPIKFEAPRPDDGTRGETERKLPPKERPIKEKPSRHDPASPNLRILWL